MPSKITLVGAGLIGSLLSVFLAKKGHRVDVFEKRPDYRKVGAEGGRSINLALSRRGWRALREAGLEEKVKPLVIPMKGRMMHSVAGELTFQPYGKEGQAIYSVERALLNEMMVNEAEKFDNVNFHFDQYCNGINFRENKTYFSKANTEQATTYTSDLIVGADGAFSAIRGAMQKLPRFNYSQSYLPHGYKELSIPPNPDGSHRLTPEALHIWPRRSFMLIALPNIDGSFTCTLFLPFEGEKNSFERLKTSEQVHDFFEEHFKDALDNMPTLLEDFEKNPTSSLITIRCNPWTYKDKVALVGDASHAIVPFYGQGMNAGLEDCFYFNHFMEKYDSNWSQVLSEYQEERIPNANAIADLALQNFVEMRDSVADEKFLLRKRIEAKLYEWFPEQWIPQYTMVTFSDLPYSYALEMGNRQKKIMDNVMQIPDIENIWQTLDWKERIQSLDKQVLVNS